MADITLYVKELNSAIKKQKLPDKIKKETLYLNMLSIR